MKYFLIEYQTLCFGKVKVTVEAINSREASLIFAYSNDDNAKGPLDDYATMSLYSVTEIQKEEIDYNNDYIEYDIKNFP